ncbi:SIMPL domain-containing protein [Shewanella sp. 10N.286.54.B9]|uniref:SIMPL domain-containing protein n=1 Tax=Shewanella sp. 10N.286.54.B9 TaxID=3229719 RepID=UPI003553F7D7
MKICYLLILLILSLPILANTHFPDSRHIAVQGSAEITTKPDIARITFEVSSLKDRAIDAKAIVDKRVNLLLAGLEGFAITEDEVTASSLLTEPYVTYAEDDNDNEVVSGYVATRTVVVSLSQIDKMNEFIDFALSVDVNVVEDVELLSSKAAGLKEKVAQLAVENAISKGTNLAKAFGATLGQIYSINSSANRSYYGYGGGVERIEVTGSKLHRSDLTQGRYLQASITFTSSISAVFDLNVNN